MNSRRSEGSPNYPKAKTLRYKVHSTFVARLFGLRSLLQVVRSQGYMSQHRLAQGAMCLVAGIRPYGRL